MQKNKVKEVVFIRHGKPLSAHNEKINAAQYAKWVHKYDKSVLDPASHPKIKTHLDNSYIMVSPLLRARLSAAHYGATKIDEEIPHLKEMDIPYYKLPFTLRAWHWVVLSRALWFLGKKGRFESFKYAKHRVEMLRERIEDLSETNERIVLFGHGMTNYFTSKSLKNNGWRLTQKDGDFWGITILQKTM